MNYSDLFRLFYRKRRAGGFKGLNSKSKIVEFFFETTMDDDGLEMLPASDSSFDKWFNGDPVRKPRASMWENIARASKANNLSKKILNLLNDDLVLEIALNFDIHLKQGEQLDKQKFACAIAEQFMEIARGYGEADNIVPREYAKKRPSIGFDVYLQGAVEKYKWMHILGEDECLLEDHFVCNRISITPMVFSSRSKAAPIEDATLKKLRTFDSRGETNHILLLGNSGSGKTLMLKHLFLESARSHREHALLPILVELRNFSYQSDDIVSCIVKCMNEFDDSFNGETIRESLLKGQCQILMDGFDEIDPSDVIEFQRKLSNFVSRYPNNQIVIASRDCNATKSIRRFLRLYIAPLDSNQSTNLIDNLLANDTDADNAKCKIVDYMNNGFIMKDGVFASNPMLLTYIVRHHYKIDTFAKNKAKFYSDVYEAVVTRHDEEKEAFDRVFKSVDNAEDFTRVFEEFCGKSYMRRLFEFDNSNFTNIFRSLKTRDALPNPVKCTMKTFQHDACATACMMYEQDCDIYYIDPGFQEYLFAEYYFNADTKTVRGMGLELQHIPISAYRNTDAFDMLYQKSAVKVEVGIYLPYLEEIFKEKTDDVAFLKYLCRGYAQFTYTVLDSDALDQVKQKYGVDAFLSSSNENEPSNMLHYLILQTISVPTSIQLNTTNQMIRYAGQERSFLVGFINNDDIGVPKNINLERFSQVLYDSKDAPDRINYSSPPLLDDNGAVCCFGNDYCIDLGEESPESLAQISDVIKSDAVGIYQTFLKVKSYYEKISKCQEANQFL